MRRPATPTRGFGSRAKPGSALPPADRALLERLKAWRLDEARAQSVPAFVILHDRTLAEIASKRPRDLAAMEAIGGIGARKLERYGPSLVELVTAAT